MIGKDKIAPSVIAGSKRCRDGADGTKKPAKKRRKAAWQWQKRNREEESKKGKPNQCKQLMKTAALAHEELTRSENERKRSENERKANAIAQRNTVERYEAMWKESQSKASLIAKLKAIADENVTKLQAECNDLKKKVEELAYTNEDLKKQAKQTKEELASAKKDLKENEANAIRTEEIKTNADKKVTKLQAECNVLTKKVEELAYTNKDLEKQAAQTKEELTRAKKEIKANAIRAEQLKTNADEKVTKLQAECNVLTKKVEELTCTDKDLEKQAAQTKEELTRAKKENEANAIRAEEIKTNADEKVTKLQAECNVLTKKVEELTCTNKDLEKQAAQTKEELTRAKKEIKANATREEWLTAELDRMNAQLKTNAETAQKKLTDKEEALKKSEDRNRLLAASLEKQSAYHAKIVQMQAEAKAICDGSLQQNEDRRYLHPRCESVRPPPGFVFSPSGAATSVLCATAKDFIPNSKLGAPASTTSEPKSDDILGGDVVGLNKNKFLDYSLLGSDQVKSAP